MLDTRFDIDDLGKQPDVIVHVVPAESLFSFMRRSFELPSGWIALVTRDDRDPKLLDAGERCEAEHVRDVMFAQSSPVDCTIEEPMLRSADGFECRGTLRVSVRLLADMGELQAFRRTLVGSRPEVTREHLVSYLGDAMRHVLNHLARQHDAETLLHGLVPSEIRGLVEEKLGGLCLSAGLSLGEQATIQFLSSSWREHQRSTSQLQRYRQRAEVRSQIGAALAEAQRQQLGELVTLLERLRDADADQGGQSMTMLLKQFSESQRGSMYAALWQLTPQAGGTRFVATVSGQQVLFFDPASPQAPAATVELPDDLGPLRSVTIDEHALEKGRVMVGAACGVHLVDLDRMAPDGCYRSPCADPGQVRGGFNAAAMSEDALFATHSQLGAVRWPLGEGEPTALLPERIARADTIRAATVGEGFVWFTADEMLWAVPLEQENGAEPVQYIGSVAKLSALCLRHGVAYAGNVDGAVVAWDVGEPESPRVIRGRGGGPVESINVIDAGGVDRLILADRGDALLALVIDDNYVCRYEAGGQTVRRATAGHDCFVAMNDARDRLLLWNPHAPGRPSHTIVVPYLTNQKAQDICRVPRRDDNVQT